MPVIATEQTIRPLTDRLLVRRIKKPEKTAGGIIRTEHTREVSQLAQVVTIGETVQTIKAGDYIIFSAYAATPWVEDEGLIFVRSGDVLAVIEPEGDESDA